MHAYIHHLGRFRPSSYRKSKASRSIEEVLPGRQVRGGPFRIVVGECVEDDELGRPSQRNRGVRQHSCR